jgi:hypothetical protein
MSIIKKALKRVDDIERRRNLRFKSQLAATHKTNPRNMTDAHQRQPRPKMDAHERMGTSMKKSSGHKAHDELHRMPPVKERLAHMPAKGIKK